MCDKDRATREQLLNTALEARIRHHEEAGFRRSEMAILVRTNKQGAHIAQHLLDVGITPQTEDSLHLGRHPGALAVVALTRWVVDPSEDRHATAWLQCMAALSPGRIDESAVLDRHVSWRQNDEGRRFASLDALGMLKDLFPDLHPLERANGPLVAWVGHACQTLGLTGRFDAYAEALMEMAREVTGTEDGGLRGFLRVWDRTGNRRSIVASGGEEAVQIMTVHKAKGLAFPVTILVAGTNVAREVKGHLPVVLDPATGLDVPAALLRVSDMKDTALDGKAEAELDAALLDQINIVYVGMTRPIARLDVLAETAKLDFDREAPAQVGQWVLACAEDVADTRFESTGDCIARGVGGGLPERTAGSDVPTDVLTTHLHLGEEVTQQVALAKGSHASVHPDGMDESALGTAVHSLLAEVNSTDTWPAVRAKFAAGWALSDEDRDKLLSWADAVIDRPESARFSSLDSGSSASPSGPTVWSCTAQIAWCSTANPGTSSTSSRAGKTEPSTSRKCSRTCKCWRAWNKPQSAVGSCTLNLGPSKRCRLPRHPLSSPRDEHLFFRFSPLFVVCLCGVDACRQLDRPRPNRGQRIPGPRHGRFSSADPRLGLRARHGLARPRMEQRPRPR